jgi:signal transduction histidine kinase
VGTAMAGRILVIDDEKVIRDGCVRILEKQGYEVVTTENGQLGLRAMEDDPAEVVLLDLMMPGIDGFETLAQIRRNWPEAYVIIITGFATVEKAVQAMKDGAFDFVAKPFNPDHLRIVIRRALENKALEAEAVRLREEREGDLRAIMTEKSRLRTIINCMDSGVLVTDRDLTVLLHNPNLIRLLEIHTDPMIGKDLLQSVSNRELCEMVRLVIEENRTIAKEFEEGSIGRQYLRARSAPVRGANGEALGSVTVFEDLSALRKIDQLKNDFVAMVSHELRAPLASVEQMAYVLRDGLAGEVGEKGQHLIGRILVRTQELLQLVRNLLDLSRIETGLLVQNMEMVDVPELVDGVIEMVRPQVEARRQTISYVDPGGCPMVVGDRDNLLGVFNNLIVNAVKYTPEQGRIDVRITHEGSFVRVDVTDTGVGIPAEDLTRIFDRFFRVKGKTRGITGSGLGLSVAKSTVEAHCGTIRVESRENVGSTFTVLLPIQVET